MSYANDINFSIESRLISYSLDNDLSVNKVLDTYRHRKDVLKVAFKDDFTKYKTRMMYKAYKGTINSFEIIKLEVDKLKRFYRFD